MRPGPYRRRAVTCQGHFDRLCDRIGWNFQRRFVTHRPPAFFIADSLGLDFLNSIATPVDTPVDWLDSGEGLLQWIAQSKLVPADALDELTARARPREFDKVADQARDLREWFRGFVRKHMGRPLSPKALRELEP